MKTTIDERKYAEVLSKRLPRVIETKQEHQRALSVIHDLMTKGKERNLEETAYLRLLVVLVSTYETNLQLFRTDNVTPLDMLKHLMESNNHTAKDLWSIADKSVVSKILKAERSISKSIAKGFAEFYNVPVSLFI